MVAALCCMLVATALLGYLRLCIVLVRVWWCWAVRWSV